MRISDWSSDVCSSDLKLRSWPIVRSDSNLPGERTQAASSSATAAINRLVVQRIFVSPGCERLDAAPQPVIPRRVAAAYNAMAAAFDTLRLSIADEIGSRSEEHTSALQSLMRISYAGFC